MNPAEEIAASSPRKVIDVIVLTDNRRQPVPERAKEHQNYDKSHIDFRSSAFKCTPKSK